MERFFIFLIIALAAAAGGGAAVVLYEDEAALEWGFCEPANARYFAAWYPELWQQQVNPIPAQAKLQWDDMNFETDAAVGVYMGEQTTGGYAIAIGRLELQAEWLIATVVSREPGPTDMVTQAFTYPSHIVTVDKSLLTRADAVPIGVRFISPDGDKLFEVMF